MTTIAMAEPSALGRVDASGLTSVSRALEALRPSQRVYVVDPDALVPRRVTRAQARRMLADVGRRNSAAIVTCRVRGPNLFISTLEWVGDTSMPAVPKAP